MKNSDDFTYEQNKDREDECGLSIMELHELVENMQLNRPTKPTKYYNKTLQFYLNELKKYGE